MSVKWGGKIIQLAYRKKNVDVSGAIKSSKGAWGCSRSGPILRHQSTDDTVKKDIHFFIRTRLGAEILLGPWVPWARAVTVLMKEKFFMA